jgi:hypothetical protein
VETKKSYIIMNCRNNRDVKSKTLNVNSFIKLNIALTPVEVGVSESHGQ